MIEGQSPPHDMISRQTIGRIMIEYGEKGEAFLDDAYELICRENENLAAMIHYLEFLHGLRGHSSRLTRQICTMIAITIYAQSDAMFLEKIWALNAAVE